MGQSLATPPAGFGDIRVLRSSHALGWRGISAHIIETEPSVVSDLAWSVTSLSVNLSGAGRISGRGEGGLAVDVETAPGLAWFVPAGALAHRAEMRGGTVRSFKLQFSDADLAATIESEFGADPSRFSLRSELGFRDPVIDSMARTLALELERETPEAGLLAETFTRAIEVYLMRRHSHAAASTPLASTRGALDDARLRRALDLIESRLDGELSLHDLAREATLSPFHFARAFKAATGAAPHQFVLERRFARAREWLATSTLSVAQVGEGSGFKSASHFSSAFRRRFGMSPYAFRVRAN